MKLKRVAPAQVVLSFQDRKRMADFVMLLATIDKRMKAHKTQEKTARSCAPKAKGTEIPLDKGPPKKRVLFFSATLVSFNQSKIIYPQQQAYAMIDTIILTLNSSAYRITDPDAFGLSPRIIGHTGNRSRTMPSTYNPTQKELRAGIYRPRLTLIPRIAPAGSWDTLLKIELSLPKLFFGNNFDELRPKDFSALIDALACSLSGMGVFITNTALAQAPVMAIHYAKNIPLTDGSTPYHFISKIKDANITQSLDVNQTDYRNDGHCYKWHCNSYEVVFYDKIRDLEQAKKSSKRAIEGDSALQLDLLDAFKDRKKFEVLRLEVRLNKRAKITQLFKQLDIRAPLTFKSLFKASVAKKVLLHYLDTLEQKRSPLLNYQAKNDKALLAALIVHNPDLSARKILQLYGLKKAMEIATPRELRGMFAKNTGRSWHRMMTEAQGVRLPLYTSGWSFKEIRKKIEQFKPMRLIFFFSTD